MCSTSSCNANCKDRADVRPMDDGLSPPDSSGFGWTNSIRVSSGNLVREGMVSFSDLGTRWVVATSANAW